MITKKIQRERSSISHLGGREWHSKSTFDFVQAKSENLTAGSQATLGKISQILLAQNLH